MFSQKATRLKRSKFHRLAAYATFARRQGPPNGLCVLVYAFCQKSINQPIVGIDLFMDKTTSGAPKFEMMNLKSDSVVLLIFSLAVTLMTEFTWDFV